MSEIDQSLIGTSTEPFLVEVEKGAIRKFAAAIGDSNPIYRDEAAARAQGFPGIVAPPTFPVSFIPPRELPWMRDLDFKRILAGEQRFDYARPVLAGDLLSCRVTFVGVDRKEGRSGSMELLRSAVTGEDADGNRVFTHSKVTVYRTPRESARSSV